MIAAGASACAAQQTPAAPPVTRNDAEHEILALSREKWRWMSERKVDTLAALFHDDAVFVHMGGTMSRNQELEVIKTAGFTTSTPRSLSLPCGSSAIPPSC